jgi:hypothetical protein
MNSETMTNTDINGQEYNPDLSPHVPVDLMHEVKLVPADSFVLPENEILKRGDRLYKTVDVSHRYEWQDTDRRGQTVRSGYSVYIRRIKDDPTLYAKMQEYAGRGRGLVELVEKNLVQELDKAKKLVRELEEKLNNNIKVGDWVVSIPSSGDTMPFTAEVSYVSIDGRELMLQGMFEMFPTKRFHKATEAEVAYQKINSKIKEGDWVTTIFGYNCIKTGTVGKVSSINNGAGILYLDDSVDGHLIGRFRLSTPVEISSELNRRNVVKVTVDGVEYVSEYNTDYVQFGCAKISNAIIREAASLCKRSVDLGNRDVTAVQIGKGLFTKEMLEKLKENIK